MQSELVRAQSQTNQVIRLISCNFYHLSNLNGLMCNRQMVKNIFTTLQKEQYAELREKVRDQQQSEKELIQASQAQLDRLKSRFVHSRNISSA